MQHSDPTVAIQAHPPDVSKLTGEQVRLPNRNVRRQQVIRQRGSTTRRGDEQQEDPTSSAREIGVMLRNAREERGLDLLAVHDRLSRPITHLEALESGNLAALPDQALALSTLRRYASFLGLDGDALALQMIDAWSSLASTTQGAMASTQGVRRIDGAGITNVVAAVSTGPDHLRAFTQTGQVPKVGGGSTSAATNGYGTSSGPPTGTFPVVPHQDLRNSRRALAKARRKLRAPRSLKVVTWVAGLLVLVVVAGFAIYQQRPQWLAQSHILRVTGPDGATVAPPTGGHPAPAHHAPAVQMTSFTTQSANYAVGAKQFTVAIDTSGPCWVQVTRAGSSTTLVSGVQPAGKHLTYTSTSALTVQLGSSAGLVGLVVNGKPQLLAKPKVVPFTYVFTPGSAS
jgi:cytoskeleton protein RodZ